MQDITTFITNHPLLCLATLVVFILAAIVEFIRAKRNIFSISAQEATTKINRDNAVIIDVRPNDIYRKGHIIAAQSQSSVEIRANLKKLDKHKTRPIILVCSNGVDSQKTAAFLLKQGYNAYSITGGMRAWISADMPIVKE